MEIKKIEYGKLTIIDIFNDWYRVPSYQRHYVWEPDNVWELLQDAGTGSCTELGCGTSHAAEPNAYNSTEIENVIRIYGRK